jgi:hypothetical protein
LDDSPATSFIVESKHLQIAAELSRRTHSGQPHSYPTDRHICQAQIRPRNLSAIAGGDYVSDLHCFHLS